VGELGFYDLDKRLEAISAKVDPLAADHSIAGVEFASTRNRSSLARSSAVRSATRPSSSGLNRSSRVRRTH
jgi:hypothetical protein